MIEMKMVFVDRPGGEWIERITVQWPVAPRIGEKIDVLLADKNGQRRLHKTGRVTDVTHDIDCLSAPRGVSRDGDDMYMPHFSGECLWVEVDVSERACQEYYPFRSINFDELIDKDVKP